MYDFIIIGAGSAGCVMAEGLSSRHSVLLIEAGGSDRGSEVAIPAAFSKLFKSDRDWNYHSEPEPTAAGRELYLPRGKMLGGSSSMNAMIYIKGRASDYDSWEAAGAIGWAWSDVSPVFKAMESNSRGESSHHGVDGPVRVEDLRSPNSFSRRFVEAALEVGIKANSDFNGESQEGVGFYQVTQKRGRRWSAADAFLRPAMDRPTLTVVTRATVSRVMLEKGAAVGVEYVKDGQTQSARCAGEVILAAGAFGSPQILQLSGIGDPDHLGSIGVNTVMANPNVGKHMQDHVVVGVLHHSTMGGTLDDAENVLELTRWLAFRRGRLTSNVAEAGAFVRSSSELHEPDLQFHFGPVNFDNHGMGPGGGPAYSLGSALINPLARGSVMASSDNPLDPPSIRGNYLAESSDVAALVRGVGISREIHAAKAFDEVRGEEMLPGSEIQGPEAIEEFIRNRAEAFYHPVGTCRMGPADSSVVDAELRVHGIEGLRVADASVMPGITSGNINAPTLMIGARAVEMILAG